MTDSRSSPRAVVESSVAMTPNLSALDADSATSRTTAMTFPGLRSSKDIDDVIAYITGSH